MTNRSASKMKGDVALQAQSAKNRKTWEDGTVTEIEEVATI